MPRFPDARFIAQHGCDNAKSLGDVLDDETDDKEGAERYFADVICRADGKSFAEIVEADTDGDDECNRQVCDLIRCQWPRSVSLRWRRAA